MNDFHGQAHESCKLRMAVLSHFPWNRPETAPIYLSTVMLQCSAIRFSFQGLVLKLEDLRDPSSPRREASLFKLPVTL